jgi:hypothetical protein
MVAYRDVMELEGEHLQTRSQPLQADSERSPLQEWTHHVDALIADVHKAHASAAALVTTTFTLVRSELDRVWETFA